MKKYKFGLKNVYRADVIEDESGNISYGTPVKINGAVSISVSSDSETTEIAADDNAQYAVINDNKGYSGDIEFQYFSDEDKAACLGMTIDSNGGLVESVNDVPKPQALLFEINNDVKPVRHVFYNVLMSKPDVASQTKGDTIENQTDTLAITVRQAKDTGYIHYSTGETTSDAIYNAWYDGVTLPNATAETRITPDDVIFDKAEAKQEDVTVTILKTASETLTSIKKGNTTLASGTDYTVTGNIVTIDKDYLATLSNGLNKLTFTFSNGIKKILEVTVVTSA